jgi:hypothetical protein
LWYFFLGEPKMPPKKIAVSTSGKEAVGENGKITAAGARVSARKRKAIERFTPEESADADGDTASSKKRKRNANTAIAIDEALAPPPSRAADGELVFSDFPDFRPNLTPEEVA